MSGSQPTIYMIRHGEKPKHGNGLTKAGQARAQGLVDVFGANSKYNIGLIMAENYGNYTPNSDPSPAVKNERPWLTIEPLYKSLEPKVALDTQIHRDAADPTSPDYEKGAFLAAINAWLEKGGQGNVLICWEHHNLTLIAEDLGVSEANAPVYPDADFDQIWTLDPPYDKVDTITIENIPTTP